MKSKVLFPVKVLVKNTPKDFKLENGTSGTSYKVTVLQGEDVNTISCEKEIYDSVQPMTNYNAVAMLNVSSYDGKPSVSIKIIDLLDKVEEKALKEKISI